MSSSIPNVERLDEVPEYLGFEVHDIISPIAGLAQMRRGLLFQS